jgi:beta-galactosidase
VNGHHLHKHLGGYLPFIIDISTVIRSGKDNIIVVRLDNRDNTITGPKPLYRLDFNTYGGIYRNVWLIEKNRLYITNPIYANKTASGGIFISTDSINKASAIIRVKTHLKNEYSNKKLLLIKHTIADKDGQIVNLFSKKTEINEKCDSDFEFSTTVINPKLWSPDYPNLYTIKTEVYSDSVLIDQEENHFGIRDIVIKPEGLWLNGKKNFLRGVNRHQEYPYIGYALSDAAQERDAYKIKEAGFDYVRTSHYPSSPAFLDACDKLGILVLEPILGWQYFGDFLFENHAKISSREMIRRDRNHPCILAWELSINEIKMPESFIRDVNKIAKEEYPYKHSYVAGWMKEGYDIYIEARQHREEAFLSKPLIVSEYGDWEYYAMNAGFEQESWNGLLRDERSSRQPRGAGEIRLLQQATNIQEAHNDNLGTHAFADGYWVMYDYNRGYADDLELSGTMDIFRLPKLSYYFFKSQRSYHPSVKLSSPMVFIASYWQPDVSKNVKVFSNCDEVELFINGVSFGKQKPDSNSISKNLKHPPFTFKISCEKPGKLKAIGYIKGAKMAFNEVSTAGLPTQIKLSVDYSGVVPKKDRNDVIFIYASVCDKDGNRVYDYDGAIQFSIVGDAEIINGNISKAEAGIAPILLKIGQNAKKITVFATGDKLMKSEVEFEAQ